MASATSRSRLGRLDRRSCDTLSARECLFPAPLAGGSGMQCPGCQQDNPPQCSFSNFTRPGESSLGSAGAITRWVAPPCSSAGSTKRSAWQSGRILSVSTWIRGPHAARARRHRDPPRPFRCRARRGPLPRRAGARRAPGHAPAGHPLPPRSRQAPQPYGPAPASRGAPCLRHSDVPRDGHAVVGGAGGGGCLSCAHGGLATGRAGRPERRPGRRRL
jgi:hypothetical protein